MYIEEIAIEGFKSYAHRTLVQGFDPKFNAITGLNGSGKSNILDSICFVLGITNLQQVRAGSLQELVYKQGQAGVTRATVSIVFNNNDKNKSPVGFEEHRQITVTRQIVIGGRNKYLINGHLAQPSRVQNLFHSVQLNVNNPHFLIMQGRITKVLNMKPPEILSMLEEAAGTRMYEVKKEAALRTLEKKQTKVDEINETLTKEIIPALEKLRRERAAYQQWLQGGTEIDRLRRFCIAYEYVLAVRQQESAVANFHAVQARIQELEEAQEAMGKEIEEREKRVAELLKEKEQGMGREMKELVGRAESLMKELVKLTSQWNNKKETLKAESKTKKKIEDSINEHRNANTDKAERVKVADVSLAEAQERASAAAAEVETAEKEFEAVQAGKSGHPGEDKSLVETLAEAKAGAVGAATEAKQMGMRMAHLGKELGARERALALRQKESVAQQKGLEKLEQEVQRVQQQLDECGHNEGRAQELEQTKSTEEPLVESLRQRIGQSVAELGMSFSYRDPVPGFDHRRVKGVLARLFRLQDPAMATALEVVAGGKLYNVVLDNEQTGKQLLSSGGLQRRVTFIPLNKIDSRSLSPAVVARATNLVGPDNVWPALSLIEYDASLEPAMKFAFGNHFICRDADTARRVAFHPDIMVPCVTMEGDSYNPGGLLTGGSRSRGGALLLRISELQRDEAALADKEALLDRVCRELSAMAATRQKHKALAAEAQLKGHRLQLLREQMQQSEVQQLAAEVASMQSELEQARRCQDEAQEREQALGRRAAELEEEIARMSREKGKRLKALEERAKKAKKEAAAAAKALQVRQSEMEQLQVELQAADQEEAVLREQLAAAEADMAAAAAGAQELAAQVAALKDEHAEAQTSVEERQRVLRRCDERIRAMEAEVAEIQERRTGGTMELKKLEHQLRQKEAEQQNGAKGVERLLRQHEWIGSERALFGRSGSEYDFGAQDPEAARATLAQKLAEQSSLEKRVNKKAMTMFERAEQEYKDLERRKDIVLRDRSKLEQAIGELDEKKKEVLQVTWEKVTRDFGAIFSTLLPGTTAKLGLPEGETDFLRGLEVKVAFGGVWKQSLSELSGGQRSLLALSLILALLLFKPAPLYILDEVDAALDLSHTQNIGRMIKNHFPHSQFIVVSLKEGMFNNANVIFRTKFVDGVSTVTRTVNRQQAEGDATEDSQRRRGGGLASAVSGKAAMPGQATSWSVKENLHPNIPN